jgi:ferredoxin
MAKKIVYVDEPVCIGCTLCTQVCPKVFEMNDDGKSFAKTQDDTEENIQQAIDSCPVNCIKWKENE